VKFSICNELFEGWKLEDVFSFLADLGYDGIEIAPFTLSDDVRKIDKGERLRIRELSETHNVKIVGLHWLLVTPKGLHITHPDPLVRKKTQDYLVELIKFNSDIGGTVLVFGSPKQRDVLEGVSRESAWKWAVEGFKRCSKVADDVGCIITIEPLARHLTNFINTVDEAVKLIEDVNSDAFKLILDVYSMTDEKRPYSDIIRRGAKYLVHFHANDTNGLGPGFGEANYQEIVDALRSIQYKGYLSVEVFDFSLGARYIASKSLENLKNLFCLNV